MTCFVETSIYPLKWEYKMLKSFQSSKIKLLDEGHTLYGEGLIVEGG